MQLKWTNALILALIFMPLFLSGQYTIIQDKPHEIYTRALTLYENENYGSAGELFDRYMEATGNKAHALYENAAYYKTICSVKLKRKNALKYVRNFAISYPESVHLPSINFELGNLYYEKRQYKNALKSYRKLSARQLSKEKRPEYYYKMGFCEFEEGRLDAAYNLFSRVKKTRGEYQQPAYYYAAYIQYKKGKYQEALDDFKVIENSRRFSKHVPKYIVHIYYELGDYDKVINEGAVLIEKADSRSKADIARLIANAYYSQQNYSSASDYFEIYERQARKKISPAEHYRIGYCKFIAENYKAAIHNFQEASRDEKQFDQNAWYHLGFCYLKTDEAKFAQNAFLKAYRSGDSKSVSTDALYNYVKVTLELAGDPYNDPVAIVETFINDNPEIPRINEAYDLLAQLYVTTRNYRGALQSIEQTKNPNPKLRKVYQQIAYAQGIDFFNRGEYSDAVFYFKKSLQFPADKQLEAEALFWTGDAYYRIKNFDEASDFYSRFFASDHGRSTDIYNLALYNYAYSAFNMKTYPVAIKYFDTFLKKANLPSNLVSDAMLRLADSYYITKNYKKAASLYKKAIADGIKGTDYALYQLAFCYGAMDDFDQKIKTLKTLTSNHKSSSLYDDALFEIASTSLILNDQRNAIVYFDKLVKERPGSTLSKKALIKMGFVYYNNKQYDRTITTLKQVVNKYPASIEATEAMNVLQNVYMDIGKMDEYFTYAKSLDFIQISTGEEDSLSFAAGEKYYIENDCANAVQSLKNYLAKFPEGGFVLSSYHYLAECFDKQSQETEAIDYYLKIIDFPDNQYTDDALLKTARYMFDQDRFQKSLDYYGRLSETAEIQGMILEGTDGAMRSAYLLQDFQSAKRYANKLLSTEQVNENQVVYAHYIIAKSALQLQDLDLAMQEFGITDKLTTGELGAESKYQLARLLVKQNDLENAEEHIYQIPEQYADFDYWIASGFILLADIYIARENSFQAEQTLQSVIDNYPGEDLKQVAGEKLKLIQDLTKEEPENEIE